MSWGNKLVIVFIAFGSFIGVLVYKSMHSSFDLVSKDYYKDELRYQEKIDARKSASQFAELSFTQSNGYLTIRFPKEVVGKTVSGEAWFYCSTHAANDKKIQLAVDADAVQLFNTSSFAKTNYLLKLSWVVNGTNYYTEKSIKID